MRPLIPLCVLALAACQVNSVERQTAALTLTAESLARHDMQMRRFDARDDKPILMASIAVLQDLGFTIEETNGAVGLVVGAKDRDAVEAGQVAGQLFLAALVAAAGGKANPVWDHIQKIRVSIITKPAANRAGVVVKVNFQRVVWNTMNRISQAESLDDPVIHQQFFDRLSKAVFLEAHQL